MPDDAPAVSNHVPTAGQPAVPPGTTGPTAEETRDSAADAVMAALNAAIQAGKAGRFGAAEAAGPSARAPAAPAAVLRGRIRTACQEQDGQPFLRLDVWPAHDPATRDTFFLDRAQPYAARRSILAPKPLGRRLPDGAAPLDASPNGFLRGGSLLPFETAAALAGQAMAAERLLGGPVELDACLDASGCPVFETMRRLPPPGAAPARPAETEALFPGPGYAASNFAVGKNRSPGA